MAEYTGFAGPRRIRVVIAANDPDLVSQIETFLNNNLTTVVAGSANNSRECLEHLNDWEADVLLLAKGLGEGAEPELDLSRQIARIRPKTAVVVMTPPDLAKNPDYLRQAMRAGVADILQLTKPLSMPAWPDIIKHAYELIRDREADTEGHGQVIVFHSLKGGVGRTLLATNLSAALATAWRTERRRVLFVDLCWHFGGAATFFNLQPARSILDLLPVMDNLNREAIENASVIHWENLHVLTSPLEVERADYLRDILSGKLIDPDYFLITADFIDTLQSTDLQLGLSEDGSKQEYLRTLLRKIKTRQVLVNLIQRLFVSARRYYHAIIVDTPATVDDVILTALRYADRVLVPCTPDVPAIQATRSELQFLDEMEVLRDRVSLVLNQARRTSEIRSTEIMDLFREDYHWLGEIPADPNIESYVNTSTLPVEAPRKTPFGEAIHSLAKAIQNLDRQLREQPARSV